MTRLYLLAMGACLMAGCSKHDGAQMLDEAVRGHVYSKRVENGRYYLTLNYSSGYVTTDLMLVEVPKDAYDSTAVRDYYIKPDATPQPEAGR